MPEKETVFTREGTIAHAMAEKILRFYLLEAFARLEEGATFLTCCAEVISDEIKACEAEGLDWREMAETVHDYYCRQYLRRQISWHDEVITVIGETKKLNTQQMTEFLNKVQADVAAEFGITLPRPEDRFFQEFYSQYNY